LCKKGKEKMENLKKRYKQKEEQWLAWQEDEQRRH
jgi:hypothetical protein